MALTAGSVAWADDLQGRVKVIQINDRVLTLENGTKLYWTETVTMSKDIKEGTMVKAAYEPRDGKFVLTKIEVIK